jgi:YegS/Rv2252/BmrU family lipid kinase
MALTIVVVVMGCKMERIAVPDNPVLAVPFGDLQPAAGQGPNLQCIPNQPFRRVVPRRDIGWAGKAAGVTSLRVGRQIRFNYGSPSEFSYESLGIRVSSQVRCIINDGAGGITGDQAREEMTRLIEEAFPGSSITFAEPGSDVAQLAREMISEGATMILAGGGDGTINGVASALVDTNTVLGVLPLGTLNHFAKDLDIPDDLEAAVRALSAGSVKTVDVGQVNNHVFLNNSGVGLYPAIVHQREVRQKEGASKWPAAIGATLRALARYRLLTIRIVTAEGQRWIRRTPIVFVGNNEYKLEGVGIPTRSRLDGGKLCLYIPHPEKRLKLLWFSFRALFGRPRASDEFDMALTPELRIDSHHRRLRISIDGEVTQLTTPLHYRVRPASLKVMAPQSAT